MRYIYATRCVVDGTTMMFTSIKDLKQYVQHANVELRIRRMQYNTNVWDWPTFVACSEKYVPNFRYKFKNAAGYTRVHAFFMILNKTAGIYLEQRCVGTLWQNNQPWLAWEPVNKHFLMSIRLEPVKPNTLTKSVYIFDPHHNWRETMQLTIEQKLGDEYQLPKFGRR